jgi:putative SbcD/Mre11-related phosphoesterase
MEILKGIEIIGKALWLKKSRTLIIGDIHIGYEEALNKQGILVPRSQFKETEKEIKELLELKPETIVINGDLKHEFKEISEQEWRETLAILDLMLKTSRVILVKGNHDNILEPIARKRGLKIVDKYEIEGRCILHGDRIIETSMKTLIIGHEHAAISLQDGMKIEKYKCFLLGKYKTKKLIVMPSFLPIIEGTDLTQDKLLSPYLTDVSNFVVFVVGDKTYRFGKLKNIK